MLNSLQATLMCMFTAQHLYKSDLLYFMVAWISALVWRYMGIQKKKIKQFQYYSETLSAPTATPSPKLQ